MALDAATDALEGAHESHSDDRRDDSDDDSRDVSSGSRASTPRDIEPSPVLDVEDEAAREEMAARAREVSEREARREKRDMARASHATDSEADAQAESRHRGGAGSIVLHTISPEEALKHVSRVHHREEVEAAEAAADLEAREREEREEEERARVADAAARGSDLMDAADDAYDDLVGSGVNDVANDIEEEMAEEDEDAWAAVGREEKEKTEEMAEEVGAEDGAAGREEKEKTGEDGAARAEDGEARAEDGSSAKSSSESSKSSSGSSSRSSSRSSSKVHHVRRAPTLKRSPHATDVHAKHSGAAASETRAEPGGGGRNAVRRGGDKSSRLGQRGGRAESDPHGGELQRAQGSERAAGGAWRSAFTPRQSERTYRSAKSKVFAEDFAE